MCDCNCCHCQVYGPTKIPPHPLQQLELTREMIDRAVKSSDEMVKRYIEEGKLPKFI